MDARDLEVRCEWCDAGFAAGTRTCIHCGRALGRRPAVPHTGLFDREADASEDGEERTLSGFWSNIVPGIAMLAFVLLSYLIRACQS